MDGALVAREYASHLSDTDLALLASAVPGQAWPGPRGAAARDDPAALSSALCDPRVFRAVLGEGARKAAAQPAPASPFLVFAVAVHRAAADLAEVGHVAERMGLRQRVPLFDAPDLRDFLSSPARRLFLAELLTSFTRVASGRYQVRRRGETRTRRYSELDPVRLAGLLEAVPEAERPGVCRRLGDVALFLAGVFPDYASAHALGPVDAARLLRLARVNADDRDRLAASPAIDLLEHLGARWYRTAWELAPVRTARLSVVAEVADRFRQARRVLNHLADSYLFAVGGEGWFARPGP